MAKPIDVRLNLDDELATFLDEEVKRLRTSGRAGYLTQLMAAVYLARQGDLSLIGMLVPQQCLTPSQAQPQQQQQQATNSDMLDDEVGGMF